MTTTTIRFDRKTCTRCHGAKTYSYCRSHGTTCFGCSGTGQQLTPRGKLQAEAYKASLSIMSETHRMELVRAAIEGVGA